MGSEPQSTTTSTAFGMVVHIPRVPCGRSRTVELFLSCCAPSKNRSHGSLPTDRQCPRSPPQRNAKHYRHTTENDQRNRQMSGRSPFSPQGLRSAFFCTLPESFAEASRFKDPREQSSRGSLRRRGLPGWILFTVPLDAGNLVTGM